MPTFSSIASLETYLQGKVDTVLHNSVAPKVESVMRQHINSDVYNVYDPSVYKRRRTRGGLSDYSNMIVESIGTGWISIGDYAPFNGENNYSDCLTRVIVSGNGYVYHSNKGNNGYERPRDFISSTKNDLKNGRKLLSSFKTGLKQEGIDVK